MDFHLYCDPLASLNIACNISSLIIFRFKYFVISGSSTESGDEFPCQSREKYFARLFGTNFI